MRAFLIAITTAAAVVLPDASRAQDYPTRNVSVVVPFPAGGGADLFARVLGQQLSVILGKPFIVENRAGAGGNIGAHAVVRAVPDGSTLLYTTSGLAISQAVYAKPLFDPEKELQPVSMTVSMPQVLVAHPSLPARNAQEFIALAKAKPGSIAYGADVGSAGHLTMEMLAASTGIRQHQVPYKGVAPIVTALMSGEVQSAFLVIPLVKPHLASGRMRAIGVSSAKRSSALPGIPTLQEEGVAGFEALQWHAFFAPARTPPHIVERLNAAIQEALKSQHVNERAVAEGAEVVRMTPAEFAGFFGRELARYRIIAKRSAISVQ